MQGEQDAPPYLVSIPLAELDNIRCTLSHNNAELVLSNDLNQMHSALDWFCDICQNKGEGPSDPASRKMPATAE